MSSTDPLLPLNWLAAAARFTVSAAPPSALRVADPSFSASSQNTTRMPLGAVENGTKPTLTASVIAKSSKNQGKRRVGNPPERLRILCSTVKHIVTVHYGLSAAAL